MDDALVAARFAHFAATFVQFGSSFFLAALAPAPLAREMAPPLRRLGLGMALVSGASALLWLAVVARDMGGGVGDVLTDTAFGRVWQARLALIALAALATWRPDRRGLGPALMSGLVVASLAFVGHAAMQSGWLGAAHRLNHVVHLTTTAGWIGGLAPFLICLNQFVAEPARRDALAAMMRFSRVGHLSVAAVFVSGALDVAMTSGSWPWPPITPWRIGLLSKVAVFAAMTALALVNRYVFAPHIRHSQAAARGLAAGVIAEIALGLAAVALVSGFATEDPNPPA